MDVKIAAVVSISPGVHNTQSMNTKRVWAQGIIFTGSIETYFLFKTLIKDHVWWKVNM